MKWEKKHTLEETVEWKGLPESEMEPFKSYVNSKVPGVCGTYAAASLTVLMAKPRRCRHTIDGRPVKEHGSIN